MSTEKAKPTLWQRISGPVKVGLFFALVAIILSLIGLIRDSNLSLQNFVLVVLISGGSWGLVSWAIAQAVVDVDRDVAERKPDDD
ncbi:MAG: hypothetical protein H5T64_04195 [Chloroflexi bacterium]|nr:hypothetical protein [Chloroflexota bacterium]